MVFRTFLVAVMAWLVMTATPGVAQTQGAPEVLAQPQRYRIFVFGDKMATGLLAGLWRVLKGNAQYIAYGRLREGSGLARPRYYDWRRAIPKVLDSKPVDIGIILLGANDARNMRVGGKTLLFGSPEWKAAYEQRVADIIEAFKSRNIALFWIGLPPVADAGRNEALKYISGIFRDKAAASGVQFVDIYKAFAGENGGYTDSGFDVSGKFTRLRSRDGVHFIKAGNTRLASLVMDAVRKGVKTRPEPSAAEAAAEPDIDLEGLPLFGRATPQGGAEIVAAKELPGKDHAFAASGVPGAAVVSSLPGQRASVKPGTAAAKLFIDGIWPDVRKGRVDDFSLPQ